MSWLHLVILAPFLFAFLVPLLHKTLNKVHTGWFVLFLPLALFIYFLGFMPFNSQAPPIQQSVSWIEALDLQFAVHLDGLALLFSLIITGVGSLVVLYSIFYMDKEREALHNFYVYLLMFMGAMLGIVLSDNMLIMYVFWELTSVSSFLLIAYWYQRQRSRYGAQKSLLITVFGGFAMLLGMLLIYNITGTFSIRETIGMADVITEHALFLPAMLLLLLGAFTKSAQFPFHIWLPDAMEAPTPISAYLHSATMVKAGVYLVARFTPIFGGNMEWFWIVTSVGLLTLFWGSFMAIKQTDLKALLAYSTVSQLGLIMSLLGIGSVALNNQYSEHSLALAGASLAAIFHLFNHSIFKGCLFMVIGILDHETGTRDIRKLGGLLSLMPVSFTLTVIGGLSMAGLPPFSGFLSKEMFFTGLLKANQSIDAWVTVLLPLAGWIASIFTFIYCMILVFKTFTGTYRPELLDKTPHEAPFGMLVAPSILASMVIVFFFFPNLLSYTILEAAVQSILPNLLASGEYFEVSIKPWHGWNTELFMTIGIVLLGSLLYASHHKWKGIYDLLPHRLSFNYLYERLIEGSERVSAKIMNKHMTGFVRDYLSYIFLFLVLVAGGSLIWKGGYSISLASNAPIRMYEAVLGVLLVVAALVVVLAKSRLTSIIAIGSMGFMVALFFVIFRAPDLALTQLVVETITTVLFMLCFYFLPKNKKEISPVRFRAANLIIAVSVGAVLTLIGLFASNNRLFDPISSYFEDAYTLAGARNMVNAILVDFRAFDTMIEGVVLFIAGIGVYTLIKLRQSRRLDR